jgi:hypothetical protein
VPKAKVIHCGAGVSCTHEHRLDKRSAYSVDGIQLSPSISRADSTSHLHRSRNRQDAGVFEQQHNTFCVDYLRTLQTAPANQSVLWHHRKRSQEANIDCHRQLRVDRHCQKAFELVSLFVRNSNGTGFDYI